MGEETMKTIRPEWGTEEEKGEISGRIGVKIDTKMRRRRIFISTEGTL